MKRWLTCAAAAALAFACRPAASAAAGGSFVSADATVPVACGASRTELPATWFFPGGGASAFGLVWLQHGFFRQDSVVADLASKLARAGLIVVTPTIPSFRPDCNFNSLVFLTSLAELFATAGATDGPLAQSARAAATSLGLSLQTLPERYVFSGHSAGGAAVTFAGKELVTRHPDLAGRLAGIVLLDPVESLVQSIRSSLPALSEVPVYAIVAAPSACNANTSGSNELLSSGRPFVGVQVTGGTHCDAEGASTDVLCLIVCGIPRALNVGVLQVLAVGWSADLLLGRTTPALYPGGEFYEALVAADVIRTW
jgi:hypothetical protein